MVLGDAVVRLRGVAPVLMVRILLRALYMNPRTNARLVRVGGLTTS